MAPPAVDGQVTYLTAPAPAEAGQVVYLDQNGQQVADPGQMVYVDQNGQQVLMEGQALEGQQVHGAQIGMEGQLYGAPMMPARINVSHEIFAKLAAGGTLTPEEMAELSGQPAPAPGSPQAVAAPGSAKASNK